MPTYALLGATGGTGSAILRCLLEETPAELKLKIFVRNRSKLLKAFPQLSNTSFPVTIVEGAITDNAAMQSCLEDADAIFMCIATNDSAPGVSIAVDTGKAITTALEGLRSKNVATYRTPTILQLRTVSLNETLSHGPSLIYWCLYYCYSDLERSCEFYAVKAKEIPGLFELINLDPPALHDVDGTQRTGHKLLTAEMLKTEKNSVTLSYSDLGGAFVDAAARRSELNGQNVVVTATGKVVQTWPTLLGYIARGAKSRVWG